MFWLFAMLAVYSFADSIGRRGGGDFLSTTGSFTLSSNRGGNSEAMLGDSLDSTLDDAFPVEDVGDVDDEGKGQEEDEDSSPVDQSTNQSTSEISKNFSINTTHPLKLTMKEETMLGPQAVSAWKSLLETSSLPFYQNMLTIGNVRSPKTYPIFAKTIMIRKGDGGAALKMGWSFL